MAIEPLTYPAPRLVRQGPTPLVLVAPAGVQLTAPESRVCEFRIAVTGTNRSTRSFGPFRGPGLVRNVEVDIQSVAGAFTQSCDIGYAATAISESLVPTSGRKLWTSFFQRLPVQGTDLSANVQGHFSSSDLTNVVRWQHDIGGIVLLDTWFLVISVMSDGATGIDMAGMVSVLSGVKPEVIANFL